MVSSHHGQIQDFNGTLNFILCLMLARRAEPAQHPDRDDGEDKNDAAAAGLSGRFLGTSSITGAFAAVAV